MRIVRFDSPSGMTFGVIDGDGRGSPNLLLEVARAMRDAEVGAVQCRVRIHNRDRVLAAATDVTLTNDEDGLVAFLRGLPRL